MTSQPMVGLHQYAHRKSACFVSQPPGGRPDATLEFMAGHPRTAARIALGHRAGPGIFDGFENMRFADMKSVNVV